MKKNHTLIIDKETIRGWLRNVVVKEFYGKQIPFRFTFDMDSIVFETDGKLTVMEGFSNRVIVFYVDNIMRAWLALHKNKYLRATPKNIEALVKYFNETLIKVIKTNEEKSHIQ